MTALFVWTIGDAVGFVIFVVVVIGLGVAAWLGRRAAPREHEWVVETELWTGGEEMSQTGSQFYRRAKLPPICARCGKRMEDRAMPFGTVDVCPGSKEKR